MLVIGKILLLSVCLSVCIYKLPTFQSLLNRHNASGLKEIALEYILRNLKDPTVELGLHDLKSEPDLLVEIITRTSDSRGDNMVDAAADFGGEWSER